VAKHDLKALMDVCGVDKADIQDMLLELRQLSPKPGAGFSSDTTVAVAPDVYVRELPNGMYAVELNSETLPRVLVNRGFHARAVVGTRSRDDRAFLAERLQSATWLVKSLEQRAATILKVAAEIRAMQAAGREVCNLTVGDFDPKQFPVPPQLIAATEAALRAGHTNYPPSDGVLELRQAVQRYYERELGLRYPIESVLIASGARPILFAAYGCVLDPGETVVYPVPSWNNSYYVQLFSARAITVPVTKATRFHPTAAELAPHVRDARLLVVNSPQNPTGTVIPPEQLRAIAQLVVDENERRKGTGQKAL
jgi:DNA-binding transcriptional MocR family regulator